MSAPPNDPRFETDLSILRVAVRHGERKGLISEKSADDSQSINCRKNALSTGGGEVFSSVLRLRPLSGNGSFGMSFSLPSALSL